MTKGRREAEHSPLCWALPTVPDVPTDSLNATGTEAGSTQCQQGTALPQLTKTGKLAGGAQSPSWNPGLQGFCLPENGKAPCLDSREDAPVSSEVWRGGGEGGRK